MAPKLPGKVCGVCGSVLGSVKSGVSDSLKSMSIGKNVLRAMLVEASWTLIAKDGVIREKYERIKARSGAKRAIVAIVRTLLLRTRRMLLYGRPYAPGLIR